MKVTHVYHSGFVVELKKSVLIFDWYLGSLPRWDSSKKIYVFVSHGHGDHYSTRIWDLEKRYPNVFYVLDSCCEQNRKGRNILHVQPGRIYELSCIRISTLLSNDEGVAFDIKTEGIEIFHAGDLNVWHWKDKTARENAYYERAYCREMEKLRGKCIDVAMIPLDPRLEENCPKAIEHFMQIVGCRYLFPMHYWDWDDKIQPFLKDPRIEPYKEKLFLDQFETHD